MNENTKKILELMKVDFKQAMELINFVPGAKEELLKMNPGPNPGLRNFFRAVAKTETDPEILHMMGIRDLPTKVRFAVISNPNTPRKTLEKMARQTANDAVARRAQDFLFKNQMSEASELRLIIRNLIKEYCLL